MQLQRIIEPNWNSVLYASFAEETDNNIKIQAGELVASFVSQGGVVKKVEDRTSSAFVGVECYYGGELVYSNYRKLI